MLSNENQFTETNKNEDKEEVHLNEAVKDEELEKNNKEKVVLDKSYHINKENKKESDTSREFREEDLKNLLLYYMKLTFELRKKNSGGGDLSQISDRTVKNDGYSVSTNYDSEEEQTSRKSLCKPPTLKCKQCSKLLRGIHSLKNHCMRKHENHSKNVLCDKCPTRFYTDFEFNRHYQTHCSVKNYLCHFCSKKFFQKSSLELHLKYHKNDRRYQCIICRKKFFTNNHLKRHSLMHTNRRDFWCDPCGRGFRYKDHLQRHLQSVHIGVKSHYCGECDKSFMFSSQLKFHELLHKEISYKWFSAKQTF